MNWTMVSTQKIIPGLGLWYQEIEEMSFLKNVYNPGKNTDKELG